MSSAQIASARDFVTTIELPSVSRSAARELPSFDFESARQQALVVGSELVSFVPAIRPEERSDIVNALLLAQLRAKKGVPLPGDLASVRNWYQQYFEVLSRIGFLIQQSNLQKYENQGEGFEAHEAVLEVAATLLVGAPTALAVLTTTLQALKKMDASNPWITLFNRESRSANTAHFQVSSVDRDADGSVFVVLTAFALEAKSNITQVLFFKFRSNEVKIENSAGRAAINSAVLAAVRPDIARKLAGLTSEYVGELEI